MQKEISTTPQEGTRQVLKAQDFPLTDAGLLELMVEITRAVGNCQTCLKDEVLFNTLKDGDGFDVDAIDRAISRGVLQGSSNVAAYNNAFLAHLLVIIFTRGKYAWDVWTDIDFLKLEHEEFHKDSPKTKGRVQSLLVVAAFENFRIAEMLVRALACGQTSYKPMLWEKVLVAEWEGLYFTPRTQSTVCFGKWECCCVSVMGADHTTCDDYSAIVNISSGSGRAFVAVCADGVSACTNSRFGSEAIAQAVMEVAAVQYKRMKSRHAWSFICRQIQIESGRQGFSMGEQGFSMLLARGILARWKRILNEKFGAPVNVHDFGTTLLFTVKIRSMLACGILGDGVFLVKTAKGHLLRLTDGYSSVKESGAPYNTALLGEYPQLLKIYFFLAKNVESVLMGSDGVDLDYLLNSAGTEGNMAQSFPVQSGAVFEMQGIDATALLNRLPVLPLQGGKESVEGALKYCAHRFSRKNVTGNGSGDDCSLVYLRGKRGLRARG